MIRRKNKKIILIRVIAMIFFAVAALGMSPSLNATDDNNPVEMREAVDEDNKIVTEVKQEKVGEVKGIIDKREEDILSAETFNAIFPNRNLAIVVAEALGKLPNEGVTQEELNSITYIDGYNRNIENISGIERLEQIYAIQLSGNKIKDLSPFLLNDFVNLDGLYLEDNEIEDISALSRIVSMRQLFVNGNHIIDPTVAETFTSEVNNAGGYKLYSFYATGQTVNLKGKQAVNFLRKNPTYSTNPMGNDHYVGVISNEGIYNEEMNQVEWPNLDENVNKLNYEYLMTHRTQGGTWNYIATITIDLEPAIVKVKYVDEEAILYGQVNRTYTTGDKDILGFQLISVLGDSKGYFSEEDIVVTYMYAPLEEEHVEGIITEEKEIESRSQLPATGGFF